MHATASGFMQAALYTTASFATSRDAKLPLPLLMWAYPLEFKSKAAASQVRGSNYTFTRLMWGDPLFHLAEGYAILAGVYLSILPVHYALKEARNTWLMANGHDRPRDADCRRGHGGAQRHVPPAAGRERARGR
jgi:hypothetical protein